MKIGLLGGTFDPIHNGHLALARGALTKLGLDRVVFIPSSRPPHKRMSPIANAHDRYQMVERAIAQTAFFEASRIEMDKKSPAYTVDTLRFFSHRFGASTQLIFLAGADCLTELGSWYQISDVVKLCRFTVVSRPGFQTHGRYEGVHFLTLPTPRLSSRFLRVQIRKKRDVRFLIPEGALGYIQRKQLYAGQSRSKRRS